MSRPTQPSHVPGPEGPDSERSQPNNTDIGVELRRVFLVGMVIAVLVVAALIAGVVALIVWVGR